MDIFISYMQKNRHIPKWQWRTVNGALQSKKGTKDQESIQSSTTPDPDTTWESDKNTIKHHKQEPIGQPFPIRWPQGSNEQTRKHEKHKT